jgi:hypothetical protein
VTAPGEADQSTEFFTAGQETPDGWRLPLRGNLISFRYFRPLDFAFEVWLGGDDDVTVRLERPFTYGRGESLAAFDPRTTRKSELAPLLEFEKATVADFVVTRTGGLSISFSDGSRLVAPPADDGHAWSLDMPGGGTVRVLPVPGHKPVVSSGPTDFGLDEATKGSPTLGATRPDGVLPLPIRGLVAWGNASGVSVGNDHVNWPHRDHQNWPHLRPIS